MPTPFLALGLPANSNFNVHIQKDRQDWHKSARGVLFQCAYLFQVLLVAVALVEITHPEIRTTIKIIGKNATSNFSWMT
jgi:hypothetical protein